VLLKVVVFMLVLDVFVKFVIAMEFVVKSKQISVLPLLLMGVYIDC
jgi:hypothetical protein